MKTFNEFLESIFSVYRLRDELLEKLQRSGEALGDQEYKLIAAVQQWDQDFQQRKLNLNQYEKFLKDANNLVDECGYKNQGLLGKCASNILALLMRRP